MPGACLSTMPYEPVDLRERILNEAEKLFIRLGYHGLSMRQIAEAVGVSKAALYYHFQDKEQLFLAMLEANLAQVAEVIREATTRADHSRLQIYALVSGILSLPTEQRAVIRLASQEMASLNRPAREQFHREYEEKFIAPIAAILEGGSRRGELRPLDPYITTWALLGMMYPYFYPAHTGDVPPPAEVIDLIVSLFLDGAARQDPGRTRM